MLSVLTQRIAEESEDAKQHENALLNEAEITALVPKFNRRRVALELIHMRQRICYLSSLKEDFDKIKSRLESYRASCGEDLDALLAEVRYGNCEGGLLLY